MRTVHKYLLTITEGSRIITFKMPAFAKPLHVAGQHGELYVWALVDTRQPLQNHELEVYMTGQDTERDIDTVTKLKHLGTVLLNGGDLVFHFFTRKSTFKG